MSKPDVICPGRGQACYPATAAHTAHGSSSIVPTAAANYTGEYHPTTQPAASSTPSRGVVVTARAGSVRLNVGMGTGMGMVVFGLALILGMF